MPRKRLMTWDAAKTRWRKSDQKLAKSLGYRPNYRFLISCKELADLGYISSSTPWTANDTYQAANKWWEEQLNKHIPTKIVHPLQDQVDKIYSRIDYAKRHGMSHELEKLADQKNEILNLSEPECVDLVEEYVPSKAAIKKYELYSNVFGLNIPNNFPTEYFEDLFGENRIWDDRIATEINNPVASDKTMKAQIENYLLEAAKKVQAGLIVAKTYDNYHYKFRMIQEVIGESVDVETLNENHISKLQSHLMTLLHQRRLDPINKSGKSDEYLNAICTLMRAFVKSLYKKRLIKEMPRNLDDLKIKVSEKTIHTMTDQEITRIIREIPEHNQLKLHILLMLNCGYRGIDIATLQVNEIIKGRIIRKRHKLKNVKNAPLVNYKLWDETIALLDRWRQENGTALLTLKGKPWVSSILVSTEDSRLPKVKRTDNIKSIYENIVMNKLSINKPYSLIRKTAASKLDMNDEFSRYAEHFLGECPSTTTGKRYQTPSQERFDAAITWLGEQYGLK